MVVTGLGRAGCAEGSVSQGVTFVQPSMMAAAVKQLKGTVTIYLRTTSHTYLVPPPSNAIPNEPVPNTRKKSTAKKPRKQSPPMPQEKALILTETNCYNAFLNGHYSNPPHETSKLNCSQAKRPLPCSLCLARSNRTLVFPPPPSSTLLPALIVHKPSATTKVATPQKLKLN
jgi:hypothetical protein